MTGDRERWDEKWRGALGREHKDPVGFVLARLDELGPGAGRRALDLASGSGRHALELARRGWCTSAWDVSPVALSILGERAEAAGLRVDLAERELLNDAGPLLGPGADQDPFDLVVVVDFLDRPLWRRLPELVVPGGHVLVRTYTLDWPGSRPPRLYRLRPGELSDGLPGLETVFHEERDGRAGLLGRRP